MSGAASRRKGHAFEVLAARELREATGLEVVTTRALGATYGADLCTITAHDRLGRAVAHTPDVLGWSIECKAVTRRNPAGWLKQAVDQAAPGTTPVVLWKRPRRTFLDGSVFLLADTGRGWVEEPIRDWFRRLVEGLAA